MGTLFGADQLRWLESRLTETANLRLIALADPLFDISSYTTELEKFFSIIRDSEAGGVLFLSGDVHFTVARKIVTSYTGMAYDTYDLTASPFMQFPNSYHLHQISNVNSVYYVSDVLYATQYGYIRLDFNVVGVTCETEG